MGNAAENHYGPVTDYSIKTNMSNNAGRGWTWGVSGSTPVAAIEATTGNMQIGGNFAQGPLIARPRATWSVAGASTGAVIIKLPGTTANYGMLHMEVDVYEYGSTATTTYILGGHNWNAQWYNYNCQTIGSSDKKVRLAVIGGQYAIVLGETGSSWSYGHVVLSKITNGGYYSANMDLGGTYTVYQDNAPTLTWSTGDLNSSTNPAISTNYIQNQNSSAQAANYYISGNARVNSGMLLPYVSNGTLSVGGGSIGGTDAVIYAEDQSNADWGIIINKGAYDYGQDIRVGSGSSYAFRVVGSGSEYFRVRGDGVSYQPFIYDINNTGYYLDPNSTSRMNEIQADRVYGFTDIRSPIFYDYNNTGYYTDPASTSRMSTALFDQTYGAYNHFTHGGTFAGDWQSLTNTAGQLNYVQVNNITSGAHSNYPGGLYTYGGVLSLRGDNHSFQLYSSHTGDLAYKTQWNNDNYSGWRTIVTSANYTSYGDNLGNHTATQALTMNGNNINSVGDIFATQNYGMGLVGVYSSTRYQNVFAMGSSYRLAADGTTTGNLYGIAWTHTNVGGQSKAGLGHQMLIMDNGTTTAAIGSGIWTSGTSYIPFIYDQQDNGYYLDPNSNSVINTVRVAGGSPAAGKVLTSSDGAGNATWEYPSNAWEYVGDDARVVCNGGAADLVYEWGIQYNNSGTILRVTCNRWNVGYRVCSYPPYPTGDSEPFRWGGVCWIWGTSSGWDDACSRYYHSYYYQTDAGKYEMWGGNGCDQNPSVYRRKL